MATKKAKATDRVFDVRVGDEGAGCSVSIRKLRVNYRAEVNKWASWADIDEQSWVTTSECLRGWLSAIVKGAPSAQLSFLRGSTSSGNAAHGTRKSSIAAGSISLVLPERLRKAVTRAVRQGHPLLSELMQ